MKKFIGIENAHSEKIKSVHRANTFIVLAFESDRYACLRAESDCITQGRISDRTLPVSVLKWGLVTPEEAAEMENKRLADDAERDAARKANVEAVEREKLAELKEKYE